MASLCACDAIEVELKLRNDFKHNVIVHVFVDDLGKLGRPHPGRPSQNTVHPQALFQMDGFKLTLPLWITVCKEGHKSPKEWFRKQITMPGKYKLSIVKESPGNSYPIFKKHFSHRLLLSTESISRGFTKYLRSSTHLMSWKRSGSKYSAFAQSHYSNLLKVSGRRFARNRASTASSMVRQGNVVLMTPSATVDDKKTFMRRMSTALREFDADVARDAEYRNGEGGSSSSSSSDEDEPETPDVRQVRRSKKLLAQELLLLLSTNSAVIEYVAHYMQVIFSHCMTSDAVPPSSDSFAVGDLVFCREERPGSGQARFWREGVVRSTGVGNTYNVQMCSRKTPIIYKSVVGHHRIIQHKRVPDVVRPLKEDDTLPEKGLPLDRIELEHYWYRMWDTLFREAAEVDVRGRVVVEFAHYEPNSLPRLINRTGTCLEQHVANRLYYRVLGPHAYAKFAQEASLDASKAFPKAFVSLEGPDVICPLAASGAVGTIGTLRLFSNPAMAVFHSERVRGASGGSCAKSHVQCVIFPSDSGRVEAFIKSNDTTNLEEALGTLTDDDFEVLATDPLLFLELTRAARRVLRANNGRRCSQNDIPDAFDTQIQVGLRYADSRKPSSKVPSMYKCHHCRIVNGCRHFDVHLGGGISCSLRRMRAGNDAVDSVVWTTDAMTDSDPELETLFVLARSFAAMNPELTSTWSDRMAAEIVERLRPREQVLRYGFHTHIYRQTHLMSSMSRLKLWLSVHEPRLCWLIWNQGVGYKRLLAFYAHIEKLKLPRNQWWFLLVTKLYDYVQACGLGDNPIPNFRDPREQPIAYVLDLKPTDVDDIIRDLDSLIGELQSDPRRDGQSRRKFNSLAGTYASHFGSHYKFHNAPRRSSTASGGRRSFFLRKPRRRNRAARSEAQPGGRTSLGEATPAVGSLTKSKSIASSDLLDRESNDCDFQLNLSVALAATERKDAKRYEKSHRQTVLHQQLTETILMSRIRLWQKFERHSRKHEYLFEGEDGRSMRLSLVSQGLHGDTPKNPKDDDEDSLEGDGQGPFAESKHDHAHHHQHHHHGRAFEYLRSISDRDVKVDDEFAIR